MSLTPAQEQEVLAAARRINKYLDAKVSEVDLQVWGYKNPGIEKSDIYQILRNIRDAVKAAK